MRTLGVVALVLALSGCLQAAGPTAFAPDLAAPPQTGDPTATPPTNAWLLDAPRPAGTTVSTGAEPSILVDKAGRWIWIGDTSGLRRSEDGGATWTRSPNPFTQTCDGWALAQDDAGTLHVANTACTHIQYARSTNGGASWASTNTLVDASVIADRPWIAARGNGEVAVLFYDFGRTNSESCVSSKDGGTTWLSRSSYLNNYPNAGNAVFDAQGRLYYATNAAVYRYAFACDLTVERRILGNAGAQIFTQLALDDEGRIHVARPTVGNGAIELRGLPGMVGAPRTLAVSPPDLRSNTYAAISAWGDEVAVAWYGSETPGDPSSASFAGSWNVYVARVRGFWTDAPTVTYDRLTNEPNHVGGFCMGGVGCGVTAAGDRDLLDYFGIDHDPQGNLHIAYGHDGVTSRSEVRYAYLPRT